jgi:RNA polymerase sigma factor for flagellar operon FliA
MACLESKFEEESLTLRNQIVENYLPYVKGIVNRVAIHLPATVEVDDLINVGTIGLMQAIERYDPTRDNKFITYAVFRIKGAVLGELRSRDFLGRTTRKKVRDLEKVSLKLEQKLGREASDEEVADEMDMDMKDFYKIKRMSSISFVSFEEIGYRDNKYASGVFGGDAILGATSSLPGPLEQVVSKDVKEAVARNIDLLPPKEKMVLNLYYSDELTMKEIGTVMNITESRVSQIHSQAVIRMRRRLLESEVFDREQLPENINSTSGIRFSNGARRKYFGPEGPDYSSFFDAVNNGGGEFSPMEIFGALGVDIQSKTYYLKKNGVENVSPGKYRVDSEVFARLKKDKALFPGVDDNVDENLFEFVEGFGRGVFYSAEEIMKSGGISSKEFL